MRDDEWGLDGDLGAPFEVVEPPAIETPIVLDSPHSGSRYPRKFLEGSRLDAMTLRRSEDSFVDDLVIPCVAVGAPLLRALFPRAYLDVNREPYELDPQMFEGRLPDIANTRSLRVAAGLGAIPRVVCDAQPIYRGPIPVAEAMARIAALHRPYHARLTALLDQAHERFGFAILLDWHSMPSTSAETGASDIVLGDRFGSSAAGWIVDTLERALRGFGLGVRRNKPYAGGYITERYGAPTHGRHAVQIEINRALYMDERRIVKLERANALSSALLNMTQHLAARAGGLGQAGLAAE